MRLAGFTAAHWLTLHTLVATAAVLLYVLTSHVMQQRRNPSAAIAWVLFILILPYAALPAYLVFGSRKLPRPRRTAAPALPQGPGREDWGIRTALALGQPAPARYHDLHLHRDGREARRALLAMIDGARHSIDVCTFILAPDALGTEVLERLCASARRGVRVRLLLDGLGRLMGGHPDLKPLSDAGGTWTLFVPPFSSPLKGRTNLRDHRKLLVIDAHAHANGGAGAHDAAPGLWCGGRNFATEYFEGSPDTPAWQDLTFDLRGALALQAQSLFNRDWAFANGQPVPASEASPADAAAPASGAQLIASGPDQVDDTVHALLVTAAYRAQQRIALITPYFVPDSALLLALCLAARRGVAVDLLMPARSNHRLSDLARCRALRALVQAGGRVWLKEGMLHAKLVVVDETLALAGSANVDTRSLFLNYEMMVAFHHPADIRRFADWHATARAGAHRYAAVRPSLLRDVAEGLLLWLGFQL